jgi:hypothetical protein
MHHRRNPSESTCNVLVLLESFNVSVQVTRNNVCVNKHYQYNFCLIFSLKPFLRLYFSIQVAPQLSSRGWVDPVPDPLLLKTFGSPGNRTQDLWICSQELWPLDHRGGHPYISTFINNKYLICFKFCGYSMNLYKWSRVFPCPSL